MLISKQILLESGDLEKFDKIAGYGKRSEKIRKLIKQHLLDYEQTKVIEEQLK